MRPIAKTPALERRVLPGGQALRELSGEQWLSKMLALVPAEIERPWVWLAPHDGMAMVGWGRTARFEASGDTAVSTAWSAFRRWTQSVGIDAPAFGSFPLSPAQQGFLVVPEVMLVREGRGRPTEVIATASAVEHLIPGSVAKAGVPSTRTPSDPGATPSGGSSSRDSTEPNPPITLQELNTADSRNHWTRAVEATTSMLGRPDQQVQKVVLSRAVDFSANRQVDQRRIATWLAAHHADCWVFAHEGLVGATPELLVEMRDGVFRCRILAGTRTHGWEGELLSDPKERREHELSVASVTSRLGQAGLTEPQVKGPFLLALPNVTHLATDILARSENSTSAHITDVLFPTAAICGTPRGLAFEQIQRVEGLDRGRFSGPVGWIAPDGAGQWGLALRCALIAPGGRSARLFAGAGILPDSRPDKEWHETQAKMAPMREALQQG